MNLAALLQNQTLATLLTALAAGPELAVGKTIEARLVSLDPDGTATALVDGVKIALVLAGPEARQAPLQPGSVLLLRIDAPAEPGTGLRATLIEARAPTPQDAASEPVRTDTPPSPARALAEAPAPTPSRSAIAAPATEAAPSPRALAGPLLATALSRQDSLAPLFANLRAIADGTVSLVLPKPLMSLVDRLLAQALPAEQRPVTAPALQDAVARSGLFREARAASGQPPLQGDLKAGLEALRNLLAPLVEPTTARPAITPAPTEPSTESQDPPQSLPPSSSPPAPPRRDGPLLPQPIAEPSLAGGEKPGVIAQTLFEQTEAGLDRLTLGQYASLPPEAARAEAQQGQRWLTEIPLAFQAGIAMLPLQIEKEPPRRDASGAQPPLWRLRFALDVEPMGPLQGVVTLQGRSVGVSLWAERPDTTRLLRAATPDLEAAIANARFENGAIDIHTGQPRQRQAMAAEAAGQFLDRLS